MQNEIKNIIFDWGNAIIDVSMNNFTEACQMAGIKFTDEEVNSTHKAGFFLAFEIGEISEDEFRNEIRKRATTSLTDIEIDTIWNKILGQTPKEKLELLYSLSSQYDLYLLSNTNAIHWNAFSKNSFICNGTNMINSFKGIYLSYQLHCAKYNPQIQISAESETKRSIFREKDKTKRSKKESAQHSKSRNKSFVMTSVSAL